MSSTLLSNPRWALAAQSLVEGCVDLQNDEDRVALLAAVCEGLGDELYPAFLRVLSLIGQNGDYAARVAVAQAVVHALRTGRLPSGRRSAWGASAAAPVDSVFGRTRCLGPIEFLCAWHAQDDSDSGLPAEQFDAAARAVMDLIGASDEARSLYCEKLLADADNPLGGTLRRDTREALRALATAWSKGASSIEASARFLDTLTVARGATVSSLLQPALLAAR